MPSATHDAGDEDSTSHASGKQGNAMIELGLQRITRLLAGNDLPWRAIHIAGTNGKGSISAYVSGMLDVYNTSKYRERTGQSKIKHARFNSPHLIDRWDCISINQQTVSLESFEKTEREALAKDQREEIGASPFELLTATAFNLFAKEDVDVGIIEVGMGGKLDATNVLGRPDESSPAGLRPAPLVAAISKIGLDHQGFLGDTIQKIARQKAGIIKYGVPVVYDVSNTAQVRKVLDNTTSRKTSRVVNIEDIAVPWQLLETEQYESLPSIHKGVIPNTGSEVEDMRPRYAMHTRHNTSVAFRATWVALTRLGRLPRDIEGLDDSENTDLAALAKTMLQVPQQTSFPGRLQKLDLSTLTGRQQPALLDGAHNAQSAAVLAEAVKQLRAQGAQGGRKVTWVLAASSSKDIAEILEPLLEAGDSVFAVQFGPVAGMPWVEPMKAEMILESAGKVMGGEGRAFVDCGLDVATALKRASKHADGGAMVIAGSLYLVGDVLRVLRDAAASAQE